MLWLSLLKISYFTMKDWYHIDRILGRQQTYEVPVNLKRSQWWDSEQIDRWIQPISKSIEWHVCKRIHNACNKKNLKVYYKIYWIKEPKLSLSMLKSPRPYMLQWLNDCGDMPRLTSKFWKISYSCSFNIEVGLWESIQFKRKGRAKKKERQNKEWNWNLKKRKERK